MHVLRNPFVLVEEGCDIEAMTARSFSKYGAPCQVQIIPRDGKRFDVSLAADCPDPEVIIITFNLRTINAVEILRALRENRRTRLTPIVMLGSIDQEALAVT